MIDLSVIVPAYNEEENIGGVLDSLIKMNYDILVVNDGSTDATEEIVESFNESVMLVNHRRNKGYGEAIKTGLHIAKGKHILIIDADGTYSAKDILKLMVHKDEYDMVVGARVGKHVKDPLLRRLGKKILIGIGNFATGAKIPDINSGLRVFKKDIAMEYYDLFPSGYSFTTTITLACLFDNRPVRFVPVSYKGRSKSRITYKDIIGIALSFVRTLVYFKIRQR